MEKVGTLEVLLKESQDKLEQAEERINLMVRESYELEASVDNARYERRATLTQNEELQAKLLAAESATTELKGQVEGLMASKSL